MMRTVRTAAVLAGIVLMPPATQADPNATSDFATQVISYTSGTGLPKDVITKQFFDDPNCALGRPTVDTTGDGRLIPIGTDVPVVPVYQPFRVFELVTVGNGGELILKFDHPVVNDPRNPYGVDLIVFGNAAQVIDGVEEWQNGDPSGTIVGGTVQAEPAFVSVSQDGQTWYTFSTGPRADVFPPTLGRAYDPNQPDPNLGGWNLWWGGETDATLPLDPNLSAAGFDGLTVAQVAATYGSSAGGIGFDIGLLGLDWIQYVRVQDDPNSSVTAEIDAVADVAAIYTLTVSKANAGTGTVLLDPAPIDANQPAYREGTWVTLTAVPAEGRPFVEWEIHDPNHPGDGNYLALDSNSSTTIMMNADRVVTARFKCGSGLGPLLPPMFVLMTLRLLSYRRVSQLINR